MRMNEVAVTEFDILLVETFSGSIEAQFPKLTSSDAYLLTKTWLHESSEFIKSSSSDQFDIAILQVELCNDITLMHINKIVDFLQGTPMLVLYTSSAAEISYKLAECKSGLCLPMDSITEYSFIQIMESMALRSKLSEKVSSDLKLKQLNSVFGMRNLVAVENEAKEQRLAEFIASLAHDLRSPLHGIINFSAIGMRKIDSVDRVKIADYLSKIQSCGNRILNLVNDLVDLSKLEAGLEQYEFRVVSISEIINIALNENTKLSKGKDIQIDFQPPVFEEGVKVDPQKILQLFNNLISNAIKFSESGSLVEIHVEDLIDSIQISVVDKGTGLGEINPQDFFSKHTHLNKARHGEKSTGLGLAICRQIVSDHSGKISVKENKDKGLQVIVELPKENKSASLKSA